MNKTGNGRGIKRVASVPRYVRSLIVSKADLLEVAWELASLTNEGDGVDDTAATYKRLVTALNDGRERRGQRSVKTYARKPGERVADRVDAAAIVIEAAS